MAGCIWGQGGCTPSHTSSPTEPLKTETPRAWKPERERTEALPHPRPVSPQNHPGCSGGNRAPPWFLPSRR